MKLERKGKGMRISRAEFEDQIDYGKIYASGYRRMLQVMGLFAKSKNAKKLILEIEDLNSISKLCIVHEADSIKCDLPDNAGKITLESATLKSSIDLTEISGTDCHNILYIMDEFAQSDEACTLILKGDKGNSIELNREGKSLTYFVADKKQG